MDTSASYFPDTFLFISPQQLGPCMGKPDAPLLLDVRPEARFSQSARLLAGGRRCAPAGVAAFAHAQAGLEPGRRIVAYCVYGHEVSAAAALTLRAAGLDAFMLAGGMEGGEDGADAADDIAQWRAHALPAMRKHADWGVTGERPSRWITRARPKIDRIACPWLIRRFIDPQAVFFYAPAAQVLAEAERLGAVAFDLPDAPLSHQGELCSFDALLQSFGLKDAALDHLARIVRGADTDCLGLAPESAGLLAVSLGLSEIHCDDHAMLEAAMPLYDALLARCRSIANAAWQGQPAETHRWSPAATAESFA